MKRTKVNRRRARPAGGLSPPNKSRDPRGGGLSPPSISGDPKYLQPKDIKILNPFDVNFPSYPYSSPQMIYVSVYQTLYEYIRLFAENLVGLGFL